MECHVRQMRIDGKHFVFEMKWNSSFMDSFDPLLMSVDGIRDCSCEDGRRIKTHNALNENFPIARMRITAVPG